MSLQSVFNYAQSSDWAREEAGQCPCRGGWFLSDVDTWHQCPVHGDGDPRNPEQRAEDWDRDEEQAESFAKMGSAERVRWARRLAAAVTDDWAHLAPSTRSFHLASLCRLVNSGTGTLMVFAVWKVYESLTALPTDRPPRPEKAPPSEEDQEIPF